jgi:hypothetical protein
MIYATLPYSTHSTLLYATVCYATLRCSTLCPYGRSYPEPPIVIMAMHYRFNMGEKERSTLLYALYATLRYATLLYATLLYATLLYATQRCSTLCPYGRSYPEPPRVIMAMHYRFNMG